MENTASWPDRDAICGAWEAKIWPPEKQRWEADAPLPPGWPESAADADAGAAGAATKRRKKKKRGWSSRRASDTTSRPSHRRTRMISPQQ
ncbi:hypothetical protein ACLOJK_020580 [Asimina triloba]